MIQNLLKQNATEIGVELVLEFLAERLEYIRTIVSEVF